MAWLNEDNVFSDAEEKVNQINSVVDSHVYEYPIGPRNEDVLTAVAERKRADEAIKTNWFFSSIGIIDPIDKTRDTYYLSKSQGAHFFAIYDVIPWTNWIGSLYTAVRQAMRRGEYPSSLVYGPSASRSLLDVGPIGQYKFQDGTVHKARFFSQQLFNEESYLEVVEEENEFGLNDIVQTIDVEQDDKLRSTMEGVYVLTGGPGVGKTTVALHRIPFLINEQNAVGTSTDHYSDVNSETSFFNQKTMLVVVWKDHLVPYLKKCLNVLGLDSVSVLQLDDWVAECLRPHIRFGLKEDEFNLGTDPKEVATAKLSIGEEDLEDFMLSEHRLLIECRGRLKKIQQQVNDWVQSCSNSLPQTAVLEHYTGDDIIHTANFLSKTVSTLLNKHEKTLEDFNKPWNVVRTAEEREAKSSAAEIVNQGRVLEQKIKDFARTELKRIRSSYRELLMELYGSCLTEDVLNDCHSKNDGWLLEQKQSNLVTSTDRYVLMAIIRFLQDNDAQLDHTELLPSYSHIVVDEAQYYEPFCLKVLHRSTRAPHNSMTIVGDLDQKIHTDGGLVTWDALGITVPDENFQRLETNYRWSENIFNFLTSLQKLFKFETTLVQPDQWHSRSDETPEIIQCSKREVETKTLVQRMAELKSTSKTKNWSVAIVLPTNVKNSLATEYEELLKSCNLRARWVTGQDIRESEQQIVITNYESIVGLEFDAVFLPQVEHFADVAGSEAAQKALWVAATRAKKYECISYVGDGNQNAQTYFGHDELKRFHRNSLTPSA